MITILIGLSGTPYFALLRTNRASHSGSREKAPATPDLLEGLGLLAGADVIRGVDLIDLDRAAKLAGWPAAGL